MKRANQRLRKLTHRYIDNSRVRSISLMPMAGTIAMKQMKKYGLPLTINIENSFRHSEYVKSLDNARRYIYDKEQAINKLISEDLKGDKRICTHIVEKTKRSSKKIWLN